MLAGTSGGRMRIDPNKNGNHRDNNPGMNSLFLKNANVMNHPLILDKKIATRYRT